MKRGTAIAAGAGALVLGAVVLAATGVIPSPFKFGGMDVVESGSDEARALGETIEAASEKFNLSPRQIKNFKARERKKGKPLRTQRIVFTKIIPELTAFLEKGGTYDAAAEKFNLSRKQIVGLVRRGKRKGKIPKNLKSPDKRLAPAGRNVEIAEYYAQGATIKELSEMFELSERYIDDILSKRSTQKTQLDSKLSSGKTSRANRRANNSRLSSGSAEVSEMGEQRIQRRIAAYEEEAKKGDSSELKLPWDGNGKLKEKPIIVSEEDDDFDDDEELSKEEKENRAAALEYAKISREEMAERTRRAEESKRRLNSPEYLEQARLRRVARNKGQETITHNADGTIKRKDGEKLIVEYEGKTIDDYPGDNSIYSINK